MSYAPRMPLHSPAKAKFQVLYQLGTGLSIAFPRQPPHPLILLKGLKFRTPQFADVTFEFVMDNGQVKTLKERDPEGEYTLWPAVRPRTSSAT